MPLPPSMALFPDLSASGLLNRFLHPFHNLFMLIPQPTFLRATFLSQSNTIHQNTNLTNHQSYHLFPSSNPHFQCLLRIILLHLSSRTVTLLSIIHPSFRLPLAVVAVTKTPFWNGHRPDTAQSNLNPPKGRSKDYAFLTMYPIRILPTIPCRVLTLFHRNLNLFLWTPRQFTNTNSIITQHLHFLTILRNQYSNFQYHKDSTLLSHSLHLQPHTTSQ